jgi:hypothetical protein
MSQKRDMGHPPWWESLTSKAPPLPLLEYDPIEREGVSTVNLNHPLDWYFGGIGVRL